MKEDDRPVRIMRAAHKSDFFVYSRETAQDKGISFEALGVLTYLLSQSDTWQANVKDIARRSTKYRIYKALRELRLAGYMTLEKEKGAGRFSQWVYKVFETKQLVESQQVENQVVEIQHTKRIQKNTDSTKKKKESSDANASGAVDTTKKDRSNPNFDAVCEYVFKTNPKDVGGDGGRIGAIAAWLNGKSDGMKRAGGKVGFISKPAEPKHIQLFARYWTQKYPNATIPHDFVKFVEAWRAWASTKKEVVIPSDPSMDLNTPQPITPILMQQKELS